MCWLLWWALGDLSLNCLCGVLWRDLDLGGALLRGLAREAPWFLERHTLAQWLGLPQLPHSVPKAEHLFLGLSGCSLPQFSHIFWSFSGCRSGRCENRVVLLL